MIRKANNDDKKAIFDIYVRNGVLDLYNQDDYFSYVFNADNILVNEVNGHIVSSIQTDYKTIVLHNEKIEASIITGIFADKNKASKYAELLKQECFRQQTFKTLVSIIPTNNPELFEQYGFTPIYGNRVYTVKRSDLDNESFEGVSKDFNIDELLGLYNTFIQNFNGYILRDRRYYKDLIDLLQKKRYNLATFHDENGKAQGYMIYYLESNKTVIKEIVYLNGLALTRLLCYSLRTKNTAIVFVSKNEDLSRAFNKIRCKQVYSAAVRINDYNLFNRLYSCEVSDNMNGMLFKGMPLYLNDVNY